MQQKPDLVITAIGGYTWEKIRPFAVSLRRSGFRGDAVILATQTDPFALECLDNRGFQVVPFKVEDKDPRGFVIKHRFIPLLQFLAKHKNEYRYVIWADASDQIFQTNPSDWLDDVTSSPVVIAARECWRIKDDQRWNDPWAKATVPDDYDWLRELEVYCGGTVAGDAETVFRVLAQVYQIVCDNPSANDQSALAYVLHKPFNLPVPVKVYAPMMHEGWTATCSVFETGTFCSASSCDQKYLTDDPPVFDLEQGLVLTPDGSKPFAMVHQYNRDARWTQIMHAKYKWG